MRTVWILLLFGSLITYHFLPPVSGEEVPSTESKPSFDQCKPYVDAALKTGSSPQESSSSSKASLKESPPGEDSDEDDNKTGEQDSDEEQGDGGDDDDSKEDKDGDSEEGDHDDDDDSDTKEEGEDGDDSKEVKAASDESEEDNKDSKEEVEEDSKESTEKDGDDSKEDDGNDSKDDDDNTEENDDNTEENDDDKDSKEKVTEVSDEDGDSKGEESAEGGEEASDSDEDGHDSPEGDDSQEGDEDSKSETASAEDEAATDGHSTEDSGEETQSDGTVSSNVADEADESKSAEDEEKQETQEDKDSSENASTTEAKADVSGEDDQSDESKEEEDDNKSDDDDGKSEESQDEKSGEEDDGDSKSVEGDKSEEDGKTDEVKSGEADDSKSVEDAGEDEKSEEEDDGKSGEADDSKSGEDKDGDEKSEEDNATEEDEKSGEDDDSDEDDEKSGEDDEKSGEDDEKSGEDDDSDEDEDKAEPYIPRSRDHVTEILGLDDSDRTKTTFTLLDHATQITLKELKRIYENAIKPLETTFKYRDLSNRHFGDPEIFSKPLIVFMGPWSGGKSTIINWLLDIKDEEGALRTGADPSPAQFNIMVHGKEEEVLDGTQLAADWTFSGLQKFGQSFLDRLRGRKLPNRLLEKVNIVEIPGILEVRKQVERSFPFNDACQWFIDRADVLFLVYDPAKLDIGPETEAILDQLKGRESQVRIILNKADTVTPDELLRVQAMLVWNISPLMSSAEPPVMYAASLWDRPLQPESPKSLLTSHENHFLKDIRDGIEKQVETRIAAARRFAVRVRNHAKMVDCYLNTYHNHRSFFSDKKKISNDIIDHPQNYHIYEGLSTLTNISRYDLPDPDTYKDFFKLNHLWDFPTLASTCSYFKGCPITKLDVAIAYELPELLGKFRRQRESILTAQALKASANPK